MNDALLIFAGLIAHAWIAKIQDLPAASVVGWLVGIILTAVALWLVLTRLGLVT